MAWKNLSENLLLSASQCWFAKLPISQFDLASQLKQANIIKSDKVFSAFSQVDRKYFTTDPEPYTNKPLPIGNGEVMTSPSTHALILEILEDPISKSKKVLDLGCGLGFLSQCFGLMNPDCHIIAVDIHKDLIQKAKQLNKLQNVEFRHCEAHEIVEDQFGVVNVGFNSTQELFDQLCLTLEDGVLLSPVSTLNGNRWLLFDGKEKVDLGEVAFSPMRVQEDLQVDLKEIEDKIKEIYAELETKLGRRPNAAEFDVRIHELLKRRRRIQNKMKALKLGQDEKPRLDS